MKRPHLYISVFLLLVGLLLTLRASYFGGNSFTAVNIGHPAKQLINFSSGLLLKGDKISGSFTAATDRLGGLWFRFDNLGSMSTDTVIFRLKQEDQSAWYYENRYKVDQFQPRQLFPFGFPIIQDSRNKKYIFEIESLSGTKENAIAASDIKPIFMSKYQFPKSILSNPVHLLEFLILKIASQVSDSQLMFSFFIYLNPFLILMSYLLTSKSKRHTKYIFAFIPILTIVLLLKYHPKTDFFVTESIIFSWLEIIYLYEIDSYLTALVVCFFTLLMAIFTSLGDITIEQARASANWMFIFLVITIIQAIVEIHSKPHRKFQLDVGNFTIRIN